MFCITNYITRYLELFWSNFSDGFFFSFFAIEIEEHVQEEHIHLCVYSRILFEQVEKIKNHVN